MVINQNLILDLDVEDSPLKADGVIMLSKRHSSYHTPLMCWNIQILKEDEILIPEKNLLKMRCLNSP